MPVYEVKEPNGGVLLDHTNGTDATQDVLYASLTARGVVRCEVTVDGERVDVVFAGVGGSHSWWQAAQGKMLRGPGLLPGQRLIVTVDGPAALRVEWN